MPTRLRAEKEESGYLARARRFNEGCDARLRGEPRTANPYGEGKVTLWSRDWLDGW